NHANSSSPAATVTREHTSAPPITTPASNQTVECDGNGNSAQLHAWLDSHGGAAASDVCSGVTWTHNFSSLSDLCGATGAATVTLAGKSVGEGRSGDDAARNRAYKT